MLAGFTPHDAPSSVCQRQLCSFSHFLKRAHTHTRTQPRPRVHMSVQVQVANSSCTFCQCHNTLLACFYVAALESLHIKIFKLCFGQECLNQILCEKHIMVIIAGIVC